ncbi:MAG TPA: DUF1206 domain-containing protein [Chloroflexota bacterium]|nr:DUF1206 domain-containing protein [Chloroflexota bacterium]
MQNVASGRTVGAARGAEHKAKQASGSPEIVLLERAGLATRGVVYIIVGVLAVLVALGKGGGATDSGGALATVGAQPYGRPLLAVITIGLIGYALFSVIRAAFNTDGKEANAKGVIARAGSGMAGIAYGALAWRAVRLMTGSSGGASSTTSAQQHSGQLLDLPFGQAALVVIGIIVLGFTGAQFYRAATSKVDDRLDLRSVAESLRDTILLLARCGIAARGVVAAIIGVFLVLAGVQRNPGQAQGADGALRELLRHPYGWLLLAVVASGLIAFGVFSLFEARYRKVGPQTRGRRDIVRQEWRPWLGAKARDESGWRF